MQVKSKRQFNLIMILCFGFCLMAWVNEAVARPAFKSEKPNIIFIMSDDHCARAIGAYGSRLASLDPTPNIDKLAGEGMLFTNVFCS